MSVSKNIVQKTNSWEPASSLGYLPELHWHLSLWPCLKGAISQWQLYWPRRQDGLSLCRTVWCTWEHDPSVVVIQHLQIFPVETLPFRTCWLAGCAWDGHGWEWMDQTPELGVGRTQGLSKYAVTPTFPAQHVRSASSCSRAVGLCRRSGRTKHHACSYHTFLFKYALTASIQVSRKAHLARPPAWY